MLQTERMIDVLDILPSDATHRDAERVFTDAGWTPCGAGDWAIALRSADGTMAVRISPFARPAHTPRSSIVGPRTRARFRGSSSIGASSAAETSR